LTGLSYNKVCAVEDFHDPGLRPVIRDVFAHEVGRLSPDYPAGCEDRKHWEVAMAVRSLSDHGAAHPAAEVLGVAAGSEATIYWLSARVRRVFATDLYLEPGLWEKTADRSMLLDPGRSWPGPWNPRRVVAQHMDALDLRYEDASFDGVFSSSSLEHFGDHAAVRRAADEMFRVLKPGGILAISTEFRVAGPSPGLPGILLFDRAELEELLVGERGWSLVSPLETDVTDRTRQVETPFPEALEDVASGRGRWRRFPHVLLRQGGHLWTSVHLTLRKSR
jgi:SAM-dependent methyltransferase